jgi:hypothetical protein
VSQVLSASTRILPHAPVVLLVIALSFCLLLAQGSPSAAASGGERAYELASPPDKKGGEIIANAARTRAAADGSAVMFGSLTAFADAHGTGVATEYLSRRLGAVAGPSTGWATHAITPAQDSQLLSTLPLGGDPAFQGDFTEDLGTGVFKAWSSLTSEPRVTDVSNLYLRRDLQVPGAGTWELVTACPICIVPLPAFQRNLNQPVLAGGSESLEHVTFETGLNLARGASGANRKVYEWHNGLVRLAGVLPNGTGATRSIAGRGVSVLNALRITLNPISDDGSRIVFTAPANNSATSGPLHMRINGNVTVQLNATERTSPVSAQPASYWDASADHSRVFFTSSEALTDDAPPDASSKLYMWRRHTAPEMQQVSIDAAGGTFTLSHNGQTSAPLAFNEPPTGVQRALEALATVGPGNVTVAGGPGGPGGGLPYSIAFAGDFMGANVPQLGASGGGLSGGAARVTVATVAPVRNLSYLNNPTGAPDPVSSAQGVIGASNNGEQIYFAASGQLVPGAPRLGGDVGIYHWNQGTTTFVGESDQFPLDRDGLLTGAPVAANLLQARVTADGQTLLFAARSGTGLLSAHGRPDRDHNNFSQLYVYSARTRELRCVSCPPSGGTSGAAAFAAVDEGSGGSGPMTYINRAVSEDGRSVFFSTSAGLVPEDTNNRSDAYEFNLDTGTPLLLSSGTGRSDSYFVDASADGMDVFFVTREQLVGWDLDQAYDLYDARSGGGFPEPEPATPPCHGDGCQGTLSGPPGPSDVGSMLYRGAGNDLNGDRGRGSKRGRRARRCRRGKVRARLRGRNRCVQVRRSHHRVSGNGRRHGREEK